MRAHKEGFDKIEVRRARLESGPIGPWTLCSMIWGGGNAGTGKPGERTLWPCSRQEMMDT